MTNKIIDHTNKIDKLKILKVLIKSKDIIEKAAHSIEPNVGKGKCKGNH